MADEVVAPNTNQGTPPVVTPPVVDPAVAAAEQVKAAEAAKATERQAVIDAYKAEQLKSVPDAYKFELPEGRTLDAKAAELAAPVFKELGLSQEAASKIVGIHDQLVKASDDALQTAIAEQNAAWVKESKESKDINTEAAQKALGKFGTPKLTQYLKDSGLGNHPELLRAFTKIGQLIKEDTVVPGQNDASGDALSRIYNHPTSKVS
jgi:hypothetical protein